MWNMNLFKPREERPVVCAPMLQDLNTGEMIPVVSPSYFELETVLLSSAYYRVHNRQHRFRLFEARMAGLTVEK